MQQPHKCGKEKDRFAEIFDTEALEEIAATGCAKCSILAKHVRTFRRALSTYRTEFALGKKLGVNHTTISRWKTSLRAGKLLSTKTEAALNSLHPKEDWSETLLFGAHGAMYSLPALLAIHDCRVNEHRNFSVKSFESSAEMIQNLRQGTTHVAVMSKTSWDGLIAPPERSPRELLMLCEIGESTVSGVSGKKVRDVYDFENKAVLVPHGTAIKTRVDDHFRSFNVRARVDEMIARNARSRMSAAAWPETALIGWPSWVAESLKSAGIENPHHQIAPNLLPATPAILACHKFICSSAPLRRFLVSFDRIMRQMKDRLRQEPWDLGDRGANNKLVGMVQFAMKSPGALNGFHLDDHVVSLIELWNAEVQKLLSWSKEP